MTEFVKVATLGDLPPGECGAFPYRSTSVALFNVSGIIHALDNFCSHQGGPLGQGLLRDTIVSCPWHGWEFDVTSGHCRNQVNAGLARYRVKIEGEDILIAP